MTSRITKTVALAALMASTAGAAYATEGWYGRADVGYSTDGEIEFGGTEPTILRTIGPNIWAWATLGTTASGLEGEISHRYNDFGENEGLADGNVHAWAAMLNGYL